MNHRSFLITSLSLAFFANFSAIHPGVGRSSNAIKNPRNENLSKTKKSKTKKTIRLFKAELYGALCKECLKSLKDEILEEEGVVSVEIDKVVRQKDHSSYAPIKVTYKSPTTTRVDLVEIIKFRDLYPLEITDSPLSKK